MSPYRKAGSVSQESGVKVVVDLLALMAIGVQSSNCDRAVYDKLVRTLADEAWQLGTDARMVSTGATLQKAFGTQPPPNGTPRN